MVGKNYEILCQPSNEAYYKGHEGHEKRSRGKKHKSTKSVHSHDFLTLQTKVIFEARRTTAMWGSGTISFNKVEINIGDGFHGSEFTVPIDGIYKLTFSCPELGRNTVKLFKNGDYEMIIMEEWNTDDVDGNIQSSIWMMKLVKGDKLKLKASDLIFSDSNKYPAIFTGELIHIALIEN